MMGAEVVLMHMEFSHHKFLWVLFCEQVDPPLVDLAKTRVRITDRTSSGEMGAIREPDLDPACV